MTSGLYAALASDLLVELLRWAGPGGRLAYRGRWLVLLDGRGEVLASVTRTADHLETLRALQADAVADLARRAA